MQVDDDFLIPLPPLPTTPPPPAYPIMTNLAQGFLQVENNIKMKK